MNLKVTAPSTIYGHIRLPASKSISNRMLLLSTLSGDKISLANVAECDDTIAMRASLSQTTLSTSPTLHPIDRIAPLKGNDEAAIIDIGAAGTAMRFLTAYFAATEGKDVIITGTERMLHRPIGLLVDALRSLGAEISYEGEEGYPPLRIKGHRLEGGNISLRSNVSSQYISALLMVAPTMRLGLTLKLEGEVISRPYINITTSLMRRFGISINEPDDHTFVVIPGDYQEGNYLIENDWSAASYWYEMLALADKGEVTLEGLFEDSLQGDSVVSKLFEPLGITTDFKDTNAILRKSSQSHILNTQPSVFTADLTTCPDLAQTMVATCCGKGVSFHFSGLQSLRIKETDRLLALRQELAKLGYHITERNGSVLEWDGKRSASDAQCPIDTYNDHRMAMCMAPLCCKHGSLIVKDAQVVSKSYPSFWHDLQSVDYGLEEL